MLETTRIRKEGYAIRPTFEEFVERYKTLAAQVTMASTAANCRKILTSSKLEGYQIGKTKVFLKYWHVDKLIELLEVVHKAASMIQKCESTRMSLLIITCVSYVSGTRLYMPEKIQEIVGAAKKGNQSSG